jgi:hypothetical protein
VFTIGDQNLKDLTPDLDDLREPTLAEVNSSMLTKIEATTPGGKMTITKKEGKWTLGDGSACDAAAVSDLIKTVSDLKASSFVSPDELATAAAWRDNPRVELKLTEQGKANPTVILVGPRTSSGKMVYVANAAEEATAAVYEEDVEQLLAGPVSYLDRKMLTFPRDRVRRLEIERAGSEPVVLTRADNKWSMIEPVAASVDGGAVNKVVQTLSSLRARRIVGTDRAAVGLDDPQVTVAVHVVPLTAEPNTKIAGEKKVDAGTGPSPAQSEPASTQPASTQPAATRPASRKAPPGMSTAELLEYTKSLPTVDNDPSGLPKQNPLAVKMLEEMLAAEQAAAATQPAATDVVKADAHTTTTTAPADTAAINHLAATGTRPADAAADAAPAAESKPEAKPTVYRVMLTRQDGKTYACVDGRDLVYELDNRVYDEVAAEMHATQIAKFDVASVVEVSFASKDGQLAFRRTGEKNWQYAGDPLLPIDAEKVKEALNDFADLKTHRYVAYEADDMAAYGLQEGAPVDRVVITPEGGERIEILVSKKGPAGDPDRSRYATKVGTKQVFLLKGEQADKCARELEGFQKSESKT